VLQVRVLEQGAHGLSGHGLNRPLESIL
jgi:hypothetical protein